MSSLIKGYEYDIFISYRQNDNKRDSWVTKFVDALRDELDATIKDPVTIYFDENPHDGLHEHHEVDGSLKEKLKCLILIPIVSQTFCDPKSFAWEHEFKVFVEQAGNDQFGLKVKLPGGNVANRVLPIRIHDLESKDVRLFEAEIGSAMRSIDFIYQETGVNRPLRANEENPSGNQNQTFYRNQVNKVANAIKDILGSLANEDQPIDVSEEQVLSNSGSKDDISAPSQQQRKATKAIAQSARIKFRQLKTVNLWRTAAIVAIVLLGLSYWPGFKSQPEPASTPVLRYEIPIEDPLNRTGRHALTISADGQQMVFILNEQFYLKQLNNDGPAVPISGTTSADHRHPFFSPDGKWIGFEDDEDRRIVKIPVNGGTPIKICDLAVSSKGLNWIGNKIIYAGGGAIYSVPDNGGIAERLYPINEDDIDTTIWNPQLLPDNKTLLFNQETGDESWNIRTWELKSKSAPTTLVSRGTDVQFLNSGHISYVVDYRLYIAGFNYKTGSLTDSPRLISTDEINTVDDASQYDFSDNGVLVYYPLIEGQDYNIVWIDKKGNISKISDNTGLYASPTISSDGKEIAVAKLRNYGDVASAEVVNSKLGTNYLFEDSARNAIWAEGTKSIIYTGFGNNRKKVFLKPRNLGEQTQVLFEMEGSVMHFNMSSDGQYLTFGTNNSHQGFKIDIGYYDFVRDTVIMLNYYNTNSHERNPVISPDGKWLLYNSEFSGQHELYVVPFPGPGPRYKISADGAAYGTWAPDMSAIYYLQEGADSDMWEVKLNVDDEFSFEKPNSLFRGHYYNNYFNSRSGSFDIHPDGDRFLMLQNSESEMLPSIKVIVNWQQELL